MDTVYVLQGFNQELLSVHTTLAGAAEGVKEHSPLRLRWKRCCGDEFYEGLDSRLPGRVVLFTISKRPLHRRKLKPAKTPITMNSRVSLLVNVVDLEDDDRYGWFVRELGGDEMSLDYIADEAEKTHDEALVAAQLLFNEGYLEIA